MPPLPEATLTPNSSVEKEPSVVYVSEEEEEEEKDPLWVHRHAHNSRESRSGQAHDSAMATNEEPAMTTQAATEELAMKRV